MKPKRKKLLGWGTEMRIPSTRIEPEYVWVSAPSIKMLERFFNDIFRYEIHRFTRSKCTKVTIKKKT